MKYKFLATVWFDKHDGMPNVIYREGTVTELDWTAEQIASAEAAGLLEATVIKNSRRGLPKEKLDGESSSA